MLCYPALRPKAVGSSGSAIKVPWAPGLPVTRAVGVDQQTSSVSCLCFAAVALVARTRFTASRRLALPQPVTEDPDGLIAAAKRYFSLGNEVVQQLGPTRRADLERELADDFEFVAPLVGPLGKDALIAATAGLDLAAAIPDFDARYHAFRLDPENPRRVWCQMRVCGMHTGELRFATVTASPKTPPVRVESPPEAVSITFTDEGKVREITTGYPLDRLCGTTSGLGGIFGILEGVGYPLPGILTRTSLELLQPIIELGSMGLDLEPEFGPLERPVLNESDALPSERLLALTEQLVLGKFGQEDSSLLSENFIWAGPFGGSLTKQKFLERAAAQNVDRAFPDVDYRYRDLRQCPFDVNRVWFTSSPVGTHAFFLRLGDETFKATGKRWESAPECGSATFDSRGKCVYLTSGYIMDRRMGNVNGLPGNYGLREAIGMPAPDAWLTRTPTQLWNAFTGR